MADQNILYFLFLSPFIVVSYSQNFGVLNAENKLDETKNGQYCITFNPEFKQLPIEESDAPLLPLKDITNTPHNYLCEELYNPPDWKGYAVAIDRGNCTFSEKVRLVQKYGGSAAVIISKTGLVTPGANSTADHDLNISVVMLLSSDFQQLKELGQEIEVQLYAPMPPAFDYNIFLIFFIAVFCVAIGSYWSGAVKHKRMIQHQEQVSSSRNNSAHVTPDSDPDSYNLSPLSIIFFVFLMSSMLILLFFFYDYLVYALIGIFAIASSFSLFCILDPLILRFPRRTLRCRIPPNKIPFLNTQPDVRSIALCLLCLGLGAWWIVIRNDRYAWILQDLLGTVFCIYVMKTARLPSFKACTILLLALFFYDIFFVFVTPYITKSGESVMVKVATGGESNEMIPMVFKVPRFTYSYYTECMFPYSLLGFGDVLVPGLLVSYCHGFDLKVSSKKVYYIGNVVAYMVGLLITFVALALMEMGQPALLYLVPCGLLTTITIALIRGEVTHLWTGKLPVVSSPERSENSEPAAAQSDKDAVSQVEVDCKNRNSESETSDSPLIET